MSRASISAFGRSLPARRAELGLTQKALAIAAGISIPAISKIEAGYYSPSIEMITKINEGFEKAKKDAADDAKRSS